MSREKNIMEQYFIRDFTRADEYALEIEVGRIPLDNMENLYNLIVRVRDDINILDEDTRKVLDGKILELNRINNERKQKLEGLYQEHAEDAVDERELSVEKVKEDFRRYKQELRIIKQLGYNKSWLE